MGSGGNLPVGPGLWGFIAAFVLALALWALMRNMNARMRRMAYRERDRVQREEARQAGQDGTDIADGTGGTGLLDAADGTGVARTQPPQARESGEADSR